MTTAGVDGSTKCWGRPGDAMVIPTLSDSVNLCLYHARPLLVLHKNTLLPSSQAAHFSLRYQSTKKCRRSRCRQKCMLQHQLRKSKLIESWNLLRQGGRRDGAPTNNGTAPGIGPRQFRICEPIYDTMTIQALALALGCVLQELPRLNRTNMGELKSGQARARCGHDR